MRFSEKTSTIITTGLAMFSMLFGAGNVVFPLAIGQYAQSQNLYAVLGFLITAVGVPFIGLISMILFNGNYKHFFERIGKVPGFIVALIIMGLIGPFGATPRLITVSFSTLNMYLPGISPVSFALISTLIIFILTYKKSSILDILGYVLTPFLLLSLAIIVVKGFWFTTESANPVDLPALGTFMIGLKEGYQTMDLPGALFFSSIVLACLEGGKKEEQSNYRQVIFMTLKAGTIGMSLLALTYIGFSYIAAFHSPALANTPKENILGTLAIYILGPYAGIVAISAVSLACLTTAIALVAVFTEFLHFDIFRGKIGYLPCLLVTLTINFFVAILGFEAIARFLVPLMIISYPSLIVLSLLNIANKLKHVQVVKTPVYITLGISIIAYFFL